MAWGVNEPVCGKFTRNWMISLPFSKGSRYMGMPSPIIHFTSSCLIISPVKEEEKIQRYELNNFTFLSTTQTKVMATQTNFFQTTLHFNNNNKIPKPDSYQLSSCAICTLKVSWNESPTFCLHLQIWYLIIFLCISVFNRTFPQLLISLTTAFT